MLQAGGCTERGLCACRYTGTRHRGQGRPLTELAGKEGICRIDDPVAADGAQRQVSVLRRLDARLFGGVQIVPHCG